jgi:hypothetical protein
LPKTIYENLKMGIGMGNYFGNVFTFKPKAHEGR